MINKDMITKDTGWINIDLRDDITIGSIGGERGEVPQYRVIGNKLYIRGTIKFTAPLSSVFITKTPLPFKPNFYYYIFTAAGGKTISRLGINPNGDLFIDWTLNINNGSGFSGQVGWLQLNMECLLD